MKKANTTIANLVNWELKDWAPNYGAIINYGNEGPKYDNNKVFIPWATYQITSFVITTVGIPMGLGYLIG